jgi:hypothetical protein
MPTIRSLVFLSVLDGKRFADRGITRNLSTGDARGETNESPMWHPDIPELIEARERLGELKAEEAGAG